MYYVAVSVQRSCRWGRVCWISDQNIDFHSSKSYRLSSIRDRSDDIEYLTFIKFLGKIISRSGSEDCSAFTSRSGSEFKAMPKRHKREAAGVVDVDNVP